MIWLKYTFTDFAEMVEDWAKILETEPDHHLLSLPPKVGKGYCYAQTVNEAMSFLVINVKFNDEVILKRKPMEEPNLVLYVNQVQIGTYYQIASDIDKIKFTGKATRRSIFLTSTNYPLELRYSKGTKLQLVGIFFRSSLVRKFLKHDVFHYLTEYSQVRLRDHDLKPISGEEDKLLKQIFKTDLKDEFGRLVIYNRVLLLVEKILYRFIITKLPAEKTKMLKDKDLGRLKEVEAILSQESLEKFPSVEELSRVALMSGTKLKKNFKEVYGMKLYEFYNYNRLSKAKQSIENGEATIKEAALNIGYANISNFSKAFKKEFGMLPSQIKSPQRNLSFGTAK
jgi:AraC-like DNA-binding protein